MESLRSTKRLRWRATTGLTRRLDTCTARAVAKCQLEAEGFRASSQPNLTSQRLLPHWVLPVVPSRLRLVHATCYKGSNCGTVQKGGNGQSIRLMAGNDRLLDQGGTQGRWLSDQVRSGWRDIISSISLGSMLEMGHLVPGTEQSQRFHHAVAVHEGQ